jgi:aminoglycoside 2''-phosphotransferase
VSEAPPPANPPRRVADTERDSASSGLPWEPDRALTLRQAQAAIRSQFPQIDVSRLEHLGAGWEFDVYLTRDEWVFRFPRRAEYATGFSWERAVHDLVAPFLKSVAVPRVELLGEPGPDFPYAFAGHRLVAGVRADHPDVTTAPSLGSELGAALTAIHSVPHQNARAIGVEPDEDGSREWLREALEAEESLRDLDPSIDDALDWLRTGVPIPVPYTGPPRLIHNDLCPDHILVDRDSGRLAGIIDWTDVALGDPALDFVVVVTWGGWDFFKAVRAGYGLPLGWDFEPRLSFLARVLSLVWLHESRQQGTNVVKHIGWIKNAFAGPDPF